jgi:hypothetical protein
MWGGVLDKLRHLKAIDRQCQAFGADAHRYLLRPCLSAKGIDEIERRLGVPLPSALRSFYTEVGDGVAGPYYGLEPAADLKGYRPGESYPGVEVFRQLAATEGSPPDHRGYFEMSHEALAGLLSIIEEGCGHQVCVISTGPRTGNVVYLSADGHVVETEQTLLDIYAEWLDGEIERFEAIRSLMSAGKSFEQIQTETIARFNEYDPGDRIASIADVQKPASLFGEGTQRIYHGATQYPWYESVLREWQQRNQ